MVKNQFDEKAACWDEDPKRVHMAQTIARAIADAVPLHKTIKALEFGCGTGLVTAFLAPRVATITAVDTSSGMLDVLRQKIQTMPLSNVIPLQTDLTCQQPPKGTFDLIYSSMAFHHIRDTRSMLRIFFGLLDPGGRLAVADLDAEDGTFHSPDTHIEHCGFDRTAFKSLLAAIGFSSVNDTIAFVIPRDRPDGVRHYPVFLITAQK